jgi:hypothetical protein
MVKLLKWFGLSEAFGLRSMDIEQDACQLPAQVDVRSQATEK